MIWSSLIGIFGNWLNGRQQIQAAKAQAKAERVANGIPGWSDEWLVLLFSYPMIGAFVPGWQENVAQGFEYISNLPDWYVGGFLSIVAAVFGIDKIMLAKDKKRSRARG